MTSDTGHRGAALAVVALAVLLGAVVPTGAQMTPEERLFDEVDSFRSSEGAVKVLLDEGADPNLANQEGVTVLMMAAMSGNEPAVAELLSGGADIDRTTEKGATALMLAARNDKDDVVDQLLAAGAEKNLVDGDGWSALMYATYNDAFSALRALVAAEADPDVVADEGWTAALLAVDGGYSNVLDALLEAGAELPAMAPEGAPALVRAARAGDTEILAAVIDRHPDLEVRGPDGETALIAAAAKGETEIVMDLLRKGADPGASDASKWTALSYAEENEFEEIQSLLGGAVKLRRPDTGDVLTVECDEMEGTVEATVRRRAEEVELTIFYPKPLGYYLGGFESGGKEVTANASFFLDVDGMKETGMEPEYGDPEAARGTEFEVELAEMRTSVASGDGRRYVHRQLMYADIEREGELLYPEDMGEYTPRAVRDLNTLSVTVPLAVFGLEPGREIRFVFEVGFCPASELTTTLD